MKGKKKIINKWNKQMNVGISTCATKWVKTNYAARNWISVEEKNEKSILFFFPRITHRGNSAVLTYIDCNFIQSIPIPIFCWNSFNHFNANRFKSKQIRKMMREMNWIVHELGNELGNEMGRGRSFPQNSLSGKLAFLGTPLPFQFQLKPISTPQLQYQ